VTNEEEVSKALDDRFKELNLSLKPMIKEIVQSVHKE
jgi:hypothetical protein